MHSNEVSLKVLRLSTRALTHFGSGHITNVFSNDAGQIEMVLLAINYIWVRVLPSASCEQLVVSPDGDIRSRGHADRLLVFHQVHHVRRHRLYRRASAARVFHRTLSRLLSVGSLRVVERMRCLRSQPKDPPGDGRTCEDHVGDHPIDAIGEDVLLGSGVQREDPSDQKVNPNCGQRVPLTLVTSRREMVRYVFCVMLNCMQMIFSHTYVYATFLLMYGMFWASDKHFDARFFAVASCMMGYLEVSLWDFGIGVHDLAHYLTAEKRMTVSGQTVLCEDERIARVGIYVAGRVGKRGSAGKDYRRGGNVIDAYSDD